MIKIKQFMNVENRHKIYSWSLIALLIIGILGVGLVFLFQPKKDVGYEYTSDKDSKIAIYDNQKLKIKFDSKASVLTKCGVYASRIDEGGNTKIKLTLSTTTNEILFTVEYDAYLITDHSLLSIMPTPQIITDNNDFIMTIETKGIIADNPLYILNGYKENDTTSYLNNEILTKDIAFLCNGRSPSLFYLWYPIFVIVFACVLISINDWTIDKGKKNEK